MTEYEQKRHILNMNWNHSINGVCKRLWHHNTTNSRKRGHPAPAYTQDELQEWIMSQPNFNELFAIWVDSAYDRFKAVSIDRLDNSKGYSFDNIQLVDFQTNCNNAHRDTRYKIIDNPTLLNGGHRAVTRFTLRGKPICSYISMSAAASELGSSNHQSISSCCLGKKLYWKDSLWCYSDQYSLFESDTLPSLSVRAIKEYILKNSKILQYNLQGSLLAQYSTLTEAAKATNLTTNLVSKWIKGKSTLIEPMFIFKRKELTIE